MSSQWDQQVDGLAESIYKMVESGNGDIDDLRGTAHQTIDKVAGILPDSARAALHDRLDSKLDELIGIAATVASESVQNVGGAESVERMIQTLRGMNPAMLDKMFAFIDKNDDSVINFDEFQSFISSAAPSGMVVTSEQALAAFRSLDVDGDGFLTKAAILGIEQSTETHDPTPDPIQEPEPHEEVIQEPEPVMAPVEEEVAPTPEPEAIVDTGSPIGVMDILARLGEARFMSEKKRITQELKGRGTQFIATIDRIRNRMDRNGMMEVEIIAEGEHFILNVPVEGKDLPAALESGKGTLEIIGEVNGFHMARNAIIILAHEVK